MKPISASEASGSVGMSARGVSVVPRIVLPSHGTAKRTRPSDVFGTISACAPGRNPRSTTTCTPWLGATIGARDGASSLRSMSRTASTQTPVALTTQRARSVKGWPVSPSRPCTPRTRPSSRSSPVAGQWFSTTAPCAIAVRASVTASRASSNWPSQYFTPPESDACRTLGSNSTVRRADSRAVGPSPRRPASASYAFKPTP